MTSTNLVAFNEALNSNKELATDYGALIAKYSKDITQDIISFASEAGFSITEEDLAQSIMGNMNLSDADLIAVSGGVSGCGIATGVLGITCGIGAVFSLGVTVMASTVGMAGGQVASASCE